MKPLKIFTFMRVCVCWYMRVCVCLCVYVYICIYTSVLIFIYKRTCSLYKRSNTKGKI